jgi:hypothetical protein
VVSFTALTPGRNSLRCALCRGLGRPSGRCGVEHVSRQCWSSRPKLVAIPNEQSQLFTSSYCGFYKMNICGNPASSNTIGANFPTDYAHFVSLCHILVILAIFWRFSLLLYLLWWSVMLLSQLFCNAMNRAHRRRRTYSIIVVFWLLHRPAVPLSLSPSSGLLIPRDTTMLKVDELITLQLPPLSSVSSHQHRGKTLHQQNDYDSPKAQTMVSIC